MFQKSKKCTGRLIYLFLCLMYFTKKIESFAKFNYLRMLNMLNLRFLKIFVVGFLVTYTIF